jgi:hypothetical protein
MSRPEIAAAPPPADNELLRKLDESLRERAKATVNAALDPAEERAGQDAFKAIVFATGPHFRSEIVRRLDEAFDHIRKTATDVAYRRLVERVTAQLTDGKPVDLT